MGRVYELAKRLLVVYIDTIALSSSLHIPPDLLAIVYSKNLACIMATAPTNSTSLPSNEVSLAGLSEIELADRAVMPVIDEVVWDGPDDPKNPINWSEKRRLISVVLISIVGFLTYVIY